jgi:hypothetical protein
MQKVQLTDQLYKEAERRAREAGFASVDEFVADQLQGNFSEDPEDLDARFTPEVIARLDRVSADMQSGKKASKEEVDSQLANAREAWRKDHAS